MASQATKYRFGPFELRIKARELYKQESRLKLRPQPCQVLLLLLERGGEAVTRDELRERLWASNTFVDFEHGLNTAIKELRGALCDSAAEPRYIETLPRLGYRLLVPVETEFADVAASPGGGGGEAIAREGLGAQNGKAATESSAPGNWRWAALGVCALTILGIIAIMNWPRTHPAQQLTPANERWMLAVLPFENLTGDSSQDYFSDGLTEQMISQFGRQDPEHLGVIARTSVMHYKHTQEQIDQIGRELGVQYVLEGSVRRDSQEVRISAQLIQVKDQTRVWSRQYDRQLSGLLALQEEIAQEIADGIQDTLGGDRWRTTLKRAPAVPPVSYPAYDLYLKGLYFWNERTVPGFQQAIECFQQSIAKDPNYAPAYAGLANSYALISGYSGAPPAESMSKARVAALRALEIDDNLPEAHTALAVIVQNYDLDWQTSEKEFRRAIQLNPNYATAHQWYAEHLGYMGRFEEAFCIAPL
ncbi:MAG: winged helix-turn-helix domain-containing protein [Candidatus Acidiferrales bacterium]